MLTVALAAACGADDDTTPTASPQSPPPPPARPQATAVQSQQDSSSGGSEVGGGTPITVINEDIGGSGAYAFNPSSLTFKIGETVTFTLRSESEFHTFTIEELAIDESLEAGETKVLNFTFQEAGTFSLVCLAHPQMTGTITVQ